MNENNIHPLTEDRAAELWDAHAGGTVPWGDWYGGSRRALTRALGAEAEVTPSMAEMPAPAQLRLLLCSDGLHGVIGLEELDLGAYEVPAAELTQRSIVRFIGERRKTLVLADLTGVALKSLGLNNDLSASADYAVSQTWARAIHGASPRWDGIRYVSRQLNKGFAYAIFERTGLRKLNVEKLEAQQVDELCDRFNVTAV